MFILYVITIISAENRIKVIRKSIAVNKNETEVDNISFYTSEEQCYIVKK